MDGNENGSTVRRGVVGMVCLASSLIVCSSCTVVYNLVLLEAYHRVPSPVPREFDFTYIRTSGNVLLSLDDITRGAKILYFVMMFGILALILMRVMRVIRQDVRQPDLRAALGHTALFTVMVLSPVLLLYIVQHRYVSGALISVGFFFAIAAIIRKGSYNHVAVFVCGAIAIWLSCGLVWLRPNLSTAEVGAMLIVIAVVWLATILFYVASQPADHEAQIGDRISLVIDPFTRLSKWWKTNITAWIAIRGVVAGIALLTIGLLWPANTNGVYAVHDRLWHDDRLYILSSHQISDPYFVDDTSAERRYEVYNLWQCNRWRENCESLGAQLVAYPHRAPIKNRHGFITIESNDEGRTRICGYERDEERLFCFDPLTTERTY